MTMPKSNTTRSADDQSALLHARLEALLEQTGSLIEQLEAVGNQQRHAVESEQVQQIVEVVAMREPIVRRMVEVGDELGAFIEDKSTQQMIGKATLERAMRQIASYEHAMKLMRERDTHDQDRMERTRAKLVRQLAGTGTGKNALRAYSTKPTSPNPIMQDKEG